MHLPPSSTQLLGQGIEVAETVGWAEGAVPVPVAVPVPEGVPVAVPVPVPVPEPEPVPEPVPEPERVPLAEGEPLELWGCTLHTAMRRRRQTNACISVSEDSARRGVK